VFIRRRGRFADEIPEIYASLVESLMPLRQVKDRKSSEDLKENCFKV
jgi:hypothetical protein